MPDVATLLLIGVLLMLAYVFWRAQAPLLAVGVVFVAVAIGSCSDDIDAHHAEIDRQQQAQRAADAKPRPVSRSDDGCTVYAFKPQDRWLYFTRCEGKQTTTTNVHQECTGSGKHRRCKDVLTEVGAQ